MHSTHERITAKQLANKDWHCLIKWCEWQHSISKVRQKHPTEYQCILLYSVMSNYVWHVWHRPSIHYYVTRECLWHKHKPTFLCHLSVPCLSTREFIRVCRSVSDSPDWLIVATTSSTGFSPGTSDVNATDFCFAFLFDFLGLSLTLLWNYKCCK